MKRNPRMYGLFKLENGVWVREYPEFAFPLPTARQMFQTALLAYALGGGPKRELRVVK